MAENIIDKEHINNLSIIATDKDESAQWKEKLNYAVRLGNEFKSKTSITFNTTVGPKTVETTVWSLTEKHISLKGGVLIPLNSVIDIHF